MRKEAFRTQRLRTAKLTLYPWETGKSHTRQGKALLSHWSTQEWAAGTLAFQNRQAEVMRMWNTIWEQAFYTKCKEISMESARRHVRSMTSRAGRSSKGSAKNLQVLSHKSVFIRIPWFPPTPLILKRWPLAPTKVTKALHPWFAWEGLAWQTKPKPPPACGRWCYKSVLDPTGVFNYFNWELSLTTNWEFSQCCTTRRVVHSFMLPEYCHWAAFTNQLK